jgi:hypothetical protein
MPRQASSWRTGGAGAGKGQLHELTITITGNASPIFFKPGTQFSSVTIDVLKPGGNPANPGNPYLQFNFGTVFTTKIDWSHGSDEGPEETITFVYGN